MRFVEDAKIAGTRKTSDGYLVADIRCARTGIQVYTGAELGRPDLSTVKVYRPEGAVFDKQSLASFAGKPVTDNHPAEMVTADNWKQLARGTIGNDIARDGEFVRVPVMLMDADLISKVESGKREVSMGYTMDVAFDAGETPDGEAYDAIMSNLKMNHLAVVERGRAGKECRVGDGAANWGVAPISATDEGSRMANRTVVVDGIPVEATDASAAVINKLLADRDAGEKALADAEAKHKADVVDRDKTIAAKDAEIADLRKKIPDQKAIDALIAGRVKLVGDARKVAPDLTVDGLTDAEVRVAALTEVHGADSVKDKSEAYVEAAFDIAVANAAKDVDGVKTDPARDALKARDGRPAVDSQTAYEKRIADAWKGETA